MLTPLSDIALPSYGGATLQKIRLLWRANTGFANKLKLSFASVILCLASIGALASQPEMPQQRAAQQGVPQLGVLQQKVPPEKVAEQKAPKRTGDTAIVENLKSGHYLILMRHALAPGTGDPAHFQLRNCQTQRNLSPAGRKQAKAIGESLKQRGIGAAAVYTSQWCRCRDTASLLGFTPPRELPLVNSFFREFQRRESQTQAAREWIKNSVINKKHHLPIILVTHQVNISALTGVFPSSGESIVVAVDKTSGDLNVVARWATDV